MGINISKIKGFNNCISSSGNTSRVTVNGRTIVVNGGSISVVNGRVFVDGKEYTDNDIFKKGYSIQNVTIEGCVGSVDCGGSVTVKGNVDGDIDCGGSVSISGEHKGSIDCGGSVKIGTFIK